MTCNPLPELMSWGPVVATIILETNKWGLSVRAEVLFQLNYILLV